MKDRATKKFNRIFYPGIIIMIVSLFLLAGTSYAWFTSTVEHNENKIEAGKIDVSVTLNNTAINLEPRIGSNSWVIQSEEVTFAQNETITIKNIGTLNVYITVDFMDILKEDQVILVNVGEEKTYTFSTSNTACIYCQSEFSYNKTL